MGRRIFCMTLLLLLVLLLGSMVVWGGAPVKKVLGKKAVVYGRVPQYAGRSISFFMWTDYITQQREVLGSTKVGKDGAFEVELPLFETQLVMLELGVYTCYMYMEPGNRYRVAFPPLRDKSESERLNPYFEPIELQMRDLDGDGRATNDLIAYFNAYSDSLTSRILPRLADHDSTVSAQKLIAQLESYPIPPAHPFVEQYKTYRIGLMVYMTETQYARGLSKTFFQHRPVLPRNPAYMDLFNIVYDKYLGYHGRTEDGQEIYDAISKRRRYSDLNRILRQNDYLENDSLRELVVLKGLFDEFYEANFSRGALFAILDSVYNTTPVAEYANIAQQIRERISKLLPGFIPHAFTLRDAAGKRVSLKDFRGSMVLLNFCTTTSYSCLQDFSLLQRFHDRYSEHLQIVCVCADQDSASMQRFVAATHYPWTFLHYGDAPQLIVDYDIRTYPTYFLLDTDGRILYSPAPGPQENLERILVDLFRRRGWVPRDDTKGGTPNRPARARDGVRPKV